MNTATLQQLFDYNYWANNQVWTCVAALSEADFKQNLDYSVGSIHTQMAHLIATEHWWFHFLATGDSVFDNSADYPSFEALRQHATAVEAKVRAYLAELTPTELERDIKPVWQLDQPPIKVWQGIMQVAYHSMDHRAQMLAGLHKLDAPTVAQDFLDYLRTPTA